MGKNIEALILAAGKGVRMKSGLPKVMHRVLGKPMVFYVLDAVESLDVSSTNIIVGFGRETIEEALASRSVSFVEQRQQLGTGHAVQCYAKEKSKPPENLLIVCGDTPLISRESLSKIVERHFSSGAALTMLTLKMQKPGSYGRIIRNKDNEVIAIREAKDCTADELKITEVNLAVYLFNGAALFDHIFDLSNDNAQKEFYLTDLVEMIAQCGQKVVTCLESDEYSTLGINSRQDLAKVNLILKHRVLDNHMRNGTTIIDPEQTLIEPGVEIGEDCEIWPGTVITGSSKIGSRCVLGPHAFIQDSVLGDAVRAKYCVLKRAKVAALTSISSLPDLS